MKDNDNSPGCSGEDIAVAFSFLEVDGYEPHVSDHSVAYRKADLCIVVSRDWQGGFTEVQFHRDSEPRLSFGLHQAVEVMAQGDSWPSHGWDAWEPETVQKYLAELALILGRVLPTLQGSSHLQVLAHDLTRAQGHEEFQRFMARQYRNKVAAAWQLNDWASVVGAYAEMTASNIPLLASEEKKLSLANRYWGDEGKS
jgi:hypothetical protein